MRATLFTLLFLFPLSFSASALELSCEGLAGEEIQVAGLNSSARHLESGELVEGDIFAPYHISLEVAGKIQVHGETIEIEDTLMLLRRGRAIHTSKESPGFSLYWSSPDEQYIGTILGKSAKVDCSFAEY